MKANVIPLSTKEILPSKEEKEAFLRLINFLKDIDQSISDKDFLDLFNISDMLLIKNIERTDLQKYERLPTKPWKNYFANLFTNQDINFGWKPKYISNKQQNAFNKLRSSFEHAQKQSASLNEIVLSDIELITQKRHEGFSAIADKKRKSLDKRSSSSKAAEEGTSTPAQTFVAIRKRRANHTLWTEERVAFTALSDYLTDSIGSEKESKPFKRSSWAKLLNTSEKRYSEIKSDSRHLIVPPSWPIILVNLVTHKSITDGLEAETFTEEQKEQFNVMQQIIQDYLGKQDNQNNNQKSNALPEEPLAVLLNFKEEQIHPSKAQKTSSGAEEEVEIAAVDDEGTYFVASATPMLMEFDTEQFPIAEFQNDEDEIENLRQELLEAKKENKRLQNLLDPIATRAQALCRGFFARREYFQEFNKKMDDCRDKFELLSAQLIKTKRFDLITRISDALDKERPTLAMGILAQAQEFLEKIKNQQDQTNNENVLKTLS